jgi:hypothetical protein
VTPISLGIFASASTAGGTSYESIAVSSVGSGGASSVSFTSIPGTYTHLQIRAIGRATRAGSTDSVKLQLNSDTTTNYAHHLLYGDGTSAISSATTSTSFIYPVITTAGTDLSNTFCAMVVDILDYTNTNKNTTVRSLSGYDANGSGYSIFTSGLWLNTAAVTSISFAPGSSNWAQYSHFALYGIKGPA